VRRCCAELVGVPENRSGTTTITEVIQMTASKPLLNLDDLAIESIGVVPAAGPEDLTQGYGLTELGASSDGESDLGGSCDCDCDR
jgi:hypothetical protein